MEGKSTGEKTRSRDRVYDTSATGKADFKGVRGRGNRLLSGGGSAPTPSVMREKQVRT